MSASIPAAAWVEVVRSGDRLLVSGELDSYSSPALVSAVAGHIGDTDIEHVQLDCSGVDFIDSAGLSALVLLADHVRRSGRTFRLAPTSGCIERLLDICAIAAV